MNFDRGTEAQLTPDSKGWPSDISTNDFQWFCTIIKIIMGATAIWFRVRILSVAAYFIWRLCCLHYHVYCQRLARVAWLVRVFEIVPTSIVPGIAKRFIESRELKNFVNIGSKCSKWGIVCSFIGIQCCTKTYMSSFNFAFAIYSYMSIILWNFSNVLWKLMSRNESTRHSCCRINHSCCIPNKIKIKAFIKFKIINSSFLCRFRALLELLKSGYYQYLLLS